MDVEKKNLFRILDLNEIKVLNMFGYGYDHVFEEVNQYYYKNCFSLLVLGYENVCTDELTHTLLSVEVNL